MFQRFINKLFGGRLQVLLIACFAFVVTFTVLIGASGTARLIQNYLSEAENERVARDMDLARSFYDLKLQDITFSGYRLANDPVVAHRLPQVLAGDDTALRSSMMKCCAGLTIQPVSALI